MFEYLYNMFKNIFKNCCYNKKDPNPYTGQITIHYI